MPFDFSGKKVLVTGAAHGFGRAISLSFAKAGAQVLACDIVAEGLEESLRQAADAQLSMQSAVIDISQKTAVDALVAKQQGFDILVNNAGGVLGQVGQPLEQVSPAQWQAIFDVNVTGAFYMTQALSPHMKAQRWGRIINISSGAGLGISLTGIQAYASAKAAQIGLTRQLAHELGAWGITVNNVAPGFVRSNPTTEKQWQSYGEAGQAQLLNAIALKRLGSPEDIAHAVLFFASDYASWVTGQVLSVDGGK